MNNATTILTGMGLTVSHDTTTTFQKNVANILGYASWGSNDSNNLGIPYYGNIGANLVPGTFLPGSFATDFVSTSARTFTGPNIANYGQSLIADLIRMGCTAANGHVEEPFLNAVSQPDQVFPNYARGYTVAEAFYTSIAFLSWENVVVCDPLMKRMLVTSQILAVSPNTGAQAGDRRSRSPARTSDPRRHGRDGRRRAGRDHERECHTDPDEEPAQLAGAEDDRRDELERQLSGGHEVHLHPRDRHRAADGCHQYELTFTVYGQHYGDAWIVFEGGYSPTPTPFPPFGDFLLDVNQPVAEIVEGTMPNLQKIQVVTLLVPNSPFLQGSTHYLQGITGAGCSGPPSSSSPIS